MTNYKPSGIITANGATIQVPNNSEIIELYDQTAASGSPDTFNLQGLSTAYQIPTGKTFHPVKLILHLNPTAGGGSKVELYKGNTENAIDTLKAIIFIPAGFALEETLTIIEYLLPTFTINDGKFFVLDPNSPDIYYSSCIGFLTID